MPSTVPSMSTEVNMPKSITLPVIVRRDAVHKADQGLNAFF